MKEIRFRIIRENKIWGYSTIDSDALIVKIYKDRDRNMLWTDHPDYITCLPGSFDIGFETLNGLYLYCNDLLLDMHTNDIYLIAYNKLTNSFIMLYDCDERFPFPIVMDGIKLIGNIYENYNLTKS
jgi:hypothetical protein